MHWPGVASGSRPCNLVRRAARSTYWFRRSGGSPRRCFCVSAPAAGKDDRQKTQGEDQPTKQSFEADRLEQLHCSFSYFEIFLLLLRLPPPCVFCRSPSSAAVVVRRQGGHVKRVPEVRASSLTRNEFSHGSGRARVEASRAQKACFSDVFS